MSHVRWKAEPEEHDFPAATAYLELLVTPAIAAEVATRLQAAPTVARRSKDLLRAARLEALGEDNVHVARDLKKVRADIPLSPVLLVRGDATTGRALIVADGFHRVCAVHLVDEDAEIPCRIVDLPT